MNFDFYDLFSKVIPGGVLTLTLIVFGYFAPSAKIPELGYLFLSYLFGFLIDAIAANRYTMQLLWKLFGGRTANKLLSGKKFYGRKYMFLQEIKSKVGDEWKEDNLPKTFDLIYRKTLEGGAKRVQGFNNHWINTRNLLISLVISSMFMMFSVWSEYALQVSIFITFLTLLSIFIIFDRAKARQFYFIKEVLDSFLFLEKK